MSACLDEARQLGLARVFALTYKPAFFEKLGFKIADVSEFPRKVWNECYRCPKFANCNEIALALDLRESGSLLTPSPLYLSGPVNCVVGTGWSQGAAPGRHPFGRMRS